MQPYAHRDNAMHRSIHLPLLAGVIAGTLLLTGCGGGGDLTPGSGLGGDLAVTVAPYLVVDLQTGSLTTRTALPEATSDPSYKTTKMAFKIVDPGSTPTGSESTGFGRQADEPRTSAALVRSYVGIFEVTRKQWQLMTGTTPWTGIRPTSLAGTDDEQNPAVGMTYQEAQTALALTNSRWRVRVALPSEAQWEAAARGGTASTFPWGESRDEAVAGLYARVAETAPSLAGPGKVGLLAANPAGLYDTGGNVWEWTTGAVARGGSWNDPLAQARSANRLVLDPASAHATIGLRLVLTP